MTGLPLQSQTRPAPTPTVRRVTVSWVARCDCGSGRDTTWTQTLTGHWWDDDAPVTPDSIRANCECEETT